jgi:hypothetical protein
MAPPRTSFAPIQMMTKVGESWVARPTWLAGGWPRMYTEGKPRMMSVRLDGGMAGFFV